VLAVAGKGLEGDRHFHEEGARPGQAITLVAAEQVEAVGLAPGETRRQVTVRGVDLNGLVGKRFRVGEVECLGVELCEPCAHLQEMTRPGIIKELAHRAGINADIVVGGTIRVGDTVEELD
jgi:MOSC domain-containing protein YiiM